MTSVSEGPPGALLVSPLSDVALEVESCELSLLG